VKTKAQGYVMALFVVSVLPEPKPDSPVPMNANPDSPVPMYANPDSPVPMYANPDSPVPVYANPDSPVPMHANPVPFAFISSPYMNFS